MPDSSIPPAETDTGRQLAALKYQRAAGKLYEDLIRATRDARDRQSNEGIHTASSYMRRTADSLMERFQTIEELFEANYLSGYKHQPMSDEDNTRLREQAAIIVDAELKRVQGLIEQLCSSFTGGSPQQYAKYVSAAESEAALMTARIENIITIQMLEHQPANPKPSDVPAKWDVFVSHASEDKPYVDILVQKLEEAGIKVWFDRTAIDWGSDLRITIDHGLKNCTYGIVVFSKAFLAQKKWTEYELSGLFALEEPGRARILPIWHGITEAEMRAYSPSLSLRLAKSPPRDSYQKIVASVKKLVNKAASPESEQTPSAAGKYPKREQLGPAAADAHYEMVGKAEPLITFVVRTLTDGSGDYLLETWVGTPLEMSSVFRGTREEVALKFVISDKEMQLKGYNRRGNFVGDMVFNLS
jgi:hypothetical protein